MGDGPTPGSFNKINWTLVIKKFPSHKNYLDGVDSCTACHGTKKPPEKGQPPLELWPPYFQHQLHLTDGSAECKDCHPSKDGKGFLPSKENCLGCHEEKIHPETGTKCTNCHALPDDPKTGHPSLYQDHKARGAQCSSCHTISPKTTQSPAPTLVLNAPGVCNTCHASNRHPDDFKNLHGIKAKFETPKCMQCHEATPKIKTCTACHETPGLAPASHKDKYFKLFFHMIEARKKIVDCAGCHETKFCVGCHANFKRMPEGHFAPTFVKDHGPQAKQDPEYCSACHGTGQRCFECHPGGIIKK